jgi:hypothetical protein
VYDNNVGVILTRGFAWQIKRYQLELLNSCWSCKLERHGERSLMEGRSSREVSICNRC